MWDVAINTRCFICFNPEPEIQISLPVQLSAVTALSVSNLIMNDTIRLFYNQFVVRGESPGCRLISTASMWEWLRNLVPHNSQGSSTERWSRNTLRVVTARVF